MSKKLIEVALPLEVINAAAAKEKSIRHGHPSTLHLWWARRPLAACRAVLFAQLVDDPSACPEEFPTAEDQDKERQRLFEIIEKMVPWENINNEKVMEDARREIARSVARAHGVRLPFDADATQVQETLQRYAPPVLDPFCGGGSIPLEAQRLGLEAHASDLNPVAVLITKALIEIPPRFANRAPVHPVQDKQTRAQPFQQWTGARGLAEDVHYYGQWMRDEAERRIGHLYPKVRLPKEHGGGEATVIAWLWARTVRCPNPACGVEMPLVRSFALSTKPGKSAWVEPQVDHTQQPPVVRFAVRTGTGKPVAGTVNRKGATCIVCGTSVPFDHVRAEGRAGRMGAQMMAIVAEGTRGRIYLPPSSQQAALAAQIEPEWKPDTSLPEQALGFRVQLYGMTRHADLFTPRQLVALTTFGNLVGAAHEEACRHAVAAGLPDDNIPLVEVGTGATAYADAVSTYLAFAADKLADRSSLITTWASNREHARNTFTRQAISMTWDYAESNPFSDSSGNFFGGVETIQYILNTLASGRVGQATQLDATAITKESERSLISTDPPYYDNVPYADLSDFFYTWLRHILNGVYPSIFSTLLVPKAQELIAEPFRHGGRESAKHFFEEGLALAFKRIHDISHSEYPLTVYYAFKQTEADDEDEEESTEDTVASTGWETMLEGLLKAGFQVTGTWPMRTELGRRMRGQNSNALASSIVLVCRPRPENTPLATRRDFLRSLKRDLPDTLKVLTSGRVAPVDLQQAAIGPGMAIFSTYAKVLEPDGRPMSVRAALGAINEVIQTYFAEQESELDPPTQFCLTWYKQYGTTAGAYGVAETLSKAKDIGLGRLERDGLLKQGGGKVQLYPASAEVYQAAWDPRNERSFTIWGATHRLVAAHNTGGNAAAAEIAAALGGYAEQARTLAYELYQIASAPGHGWTEEALGYNHLVADWPEIQKQAAAVGTRARQGELGI